MQMPYAENPYNNYQPAMGGAYEPESQQSRPTGFLGRIFGGRRSRGQQAVPQHDDPNNLPAHAQPIDMANSNNRDSEATAVGHEQQPPYNKYETGYGNVTSPTTHGPMVTGQTDDGVSPIEAPATYTYTQAGNPYTHATGDSYTHAGDHYGHAGDDYYQQHHSNAGAHNANTTSTLPYPADNPYDSPYEPHRTEPPSHLTMPPRYPAQSHHYDDGIYDRP